MGSKSGSKVDVYDYHMAMHMGFTISGSGISLLALFMGEKEVWRGNQASGATISVQKNNLFGGDKREGGVAGTVHWLPGDGAQVLSDGLAGRVGLTGLTCPAYRGLASIFFTGAASTGLQFKWGTNNPYIKDIWARIRRTPVGLPSANALIALSNDSNGNAQFAANPAHILYEVLTNTDWGMGADATAIDYQSYLDASNVLAAENFGLAFQWLRQSTIEAFESEVIDHIQAVRYPNPKTGKLTLKLLRNDYDVTTLREINPSNANLKNFQRKLWGETANQVVVSWTNPETEKTETVTAQDLAAIAAQGQIVSASRNYYGVRSATLAATLAERDLAAVVQPIATCEAEVDRSMWDVSPGDVLKLAWPENNIAQIIMRVMDVDPGQPGASAVKLSMTEDIFGMDYANYLTGQGTSWVDPTTVPAPLTRTNLGTAPAYLMASALGFADPSSIQYPEALTMVIAGANTQDDTGYDLYSNITLPNGSVTPGNLASKSLLASGVLPTSISSEITTLIPAFSSLIGADAVAGNFVLIGNGLDSANEIALVQTVDGTGVTLNRGVLDTVPRSWGAGTRVWILADQNPVDTTLRADTEAVTYKLLTRTSGGVLDYNAAPDEPVTLTDRPHRPLRPANVKFNGVGFGAVPIPGTSTVNVTWANRNRITESAQVLKWNAGSVAVETGQTTKIEVFDDLGVIVNTVSGLTGTSHTFNTTVFTGITNGKIRVSSVRNGFTSLQFHEINIV